MIGAVTTSGRAGSSARRVPPFCVMLSCTVPPPAITPPPLMGLALLLTDPVPSSLPPERLIRATLATKAGLKLLPIGTLMEPLLLTIVADIAPVTLTTP